MASNKPQNNEDIDALLAIASLPPDPKEKEEELSSIEQWLIEKDIQAGEQIITAYAMYYEYKRWAKKPIPFPVFRLQIKQCLKVRGIEKKGHRSGYAVNPEPFDLTLDNHFEVMKELRKVRELRRKRSNDKKKAEGNPESSES